jgi:hypothetical protein
VKFPLTEFRHRSKITNRGKCRVYRASGVNEAAVTFGWRFFASGGRESFPRTNPRLEDRRRVIGRLKTQRGNSRKGLHHGTQKGP